MLVPITIIAQRSGSPDLNLYERLDELKVPTRGEAAYYQYLPQYLKDCLLLPPDAEFAQKATSARTSAYKRQQLLLGWHEWLFDRSLIDNEQLWHSYCELLGFGAAVARGGKIPAWATDTSSRQAYGSDCRFRRSFRFSSR